jgi:phosphoribosylanthranilate isomerase
MSRILVKICGITSVADARAAVDAGADLLGVNFYEHSPRCIGFELAREIARAVDGRAGMVGVFVNMDLPGLLYIARRVPLNSVQLHGDELPADCQRLSAEFDVIRALKADGASTVKAVAMFGRCSSSVLLDTACAERGGSGRTFNWKALDWVAIRASAPRAKLILAGGLHPGNIAEAISAVHPDAVDVCSGVESEKGIKSAEKMGEFVAAVRAAERQEL